MSWFWTLAFVISLASTLFQLHSLHNEETIDDHPLLHEVSERGCDTNPGDCFRGVLFRLYYRPILQATFALGTRYHPVNIPPYGQNLPLPIAFRIENLLLHLAVALFGFWLFRLLFRSAYPAFVAGILFALHPLQVSITAFIGGRTDTLALFFLLPAAAALIKWGETAERRSAWAGLWALLSLCCWTLALFSKEQCLPLLLISPLLYAARREHTQSFFITAGIFSLFAVPVAVYLYLASKYIPRDHFPPAPWGAGLRIEMVGRTLWYYVKIFLWPSVKTLHLSSLGPWEERQPLVAALGFLAAILLAALTWRWRDNRSVRILTLWAGTTLLPVLNLIPAPSQFASAYRAALPLIGITGIAGLALPRLLPNPRLLCVALTGVCVCFIAITIAEVRVWKNDLTLEYVVWRADPNFLPAEGGIAGLSQKQANLEWYRGKPDEAMRLFRIASVRYDHVVERLFPDAPSEDQKIALAGSPLLAVRLKSQSSLRYEPGGPTGYVTLVMRGRGGTRQALGRYDEAASDYRVALAYYPSDDEVRFALVECYRRNGDPRLTEAMRNLAHRPLDGYQFALLGETAMNEGEYTIAEETLRRAVSILQDQDNVSPSYLSRLRRFYDQAKLLRNYDNTKREASGFQPDPGSP